MNNPLFEIESLNSLPAFSKIKPSHIKKALTQVITENNQAINELCQICSSSQGSAANSKMVITAMEELDNRLSRIWSPVSHLNAVMNSDELRAVYTDCLAVLSDYHTEMGQHKELYQLIKNIAKTDDGSDPSMSMVLSNLLKNFELTGISLSESKQAKFKELSRKLSELSSRFSDNVLDATNAWTKEISQEDALEGLPESALEMAKSLAMQREKQGWLLTLDFPMFNAVITYADDRELREEVYKAFFTRASDQADDTTLDNSKTMEETIKVRTEIARLLGFDSFAEQSLSKKMADSAEQVITFLSDLLKKSKPQAEKEMQALQAFAKEELAIESPQAWDMAYIREKLQQQELDYSEEDIKPWFSVENVLAGLFKLIEQLYQCRIAIKTGVDVWHKDVRFYEIYDTNNHHIASFYLDLFSRQHKRGGAWMGSFCGRYIQKNKKNQSDEIQIPVAYLTCNSSTPSENKPALFTHREIITLFHEFGHGLHHMLTSVDYLDVSGISGVEWDAVELPSQFMENWCWQRESLDLFAKHYETGQLIPDDLFNKMLKTRHYYSALDMLRQLEFSLFDMRLHMQSNIKKYSEISTILDEVREQTSILPIPAFNRFQNSFSHIFAGGYAAGYYSYKWAEVLSADVFSKFEETGLFNQKTAKSFLHEILEMGGSRPAKDSFHAFMGREPDIRALLRHSGIHFST